MKSQQKCGFAIVIYKTADFISEGRKQITDVGNQIAWIVHSRNPFDPYAPSIHRCPTLCAMPMALCPFCPQLVTCNSQLAIKQFRTPNFEFNSPRHFLHRFFEYGQTSVDLTGGHGQGWRKPDTVFTATQQEQSFFESLFDDAAAPLGSRRRFATWQPRRSALAPAVLG